MKTKVNQSLFFIILFLTFLGFYSILLIGLNLNMSGFTRQLSIPIRLVITISCLIVLALNYRNRAKYLIYFVLFFLIYLLRIFLDITSLKTFYISYQELTLYFFSFCVIPFIAITKLDFSNINVLNSYKVFLLSALLFSSLSALFYSKFIGQVYRLTTSAAGEDVISPLILSYCSALAIGVSIVYIIYNRSNKFILIVSFILIALSVVPFFLGASRGSIFALFFPFIILGIHHISLGNISKYSLLFAVLIFSLIYLDNYFQSNLLNRFLSTSEAIEYGTSSASRLDIWKNSFSQFLDYPLLGDKLNTDKVNHYPHNIYIEVLQTTGIVGFIPFSILIFKGVKACIRIFKKNPKYAWITVFYLQTLMQNMFSGALYSAAWFWSSLAIILSLDRFLKTKNN